MTAADVLQFESLITAGIAVIVFALGYLAGFAQ